MGPAASIGVAEHLAAVLTGAHPSPPVPIPTICPRWPGLTASR